MDYKVIFQSFYDNADAEKATGMAAYMRDQFPFVGIPTPKRKALSKPLLKAAAKSAACDWDFINLCWHQPEREFQYLAIGYLDAVKTLLVPSDMDQIRHLAVTKSWWDTIDGLDRIAGHIALSYPAVNDMLLAWSVDENIWLRRIAIDHQLLRKDKTDTTLLAQIIENNLGLTEFFINKAIGWSLREFSKTNPNWVRTFIDEHKDRMAALSIREASKYI